jgi:rod shape-determining protein MreD
MPSHNTLAYAYFLSTVAATMILRVMSINPALDAFNPDWVALALIYWSMAFPERFGVFTAWSIGLLTDVLTGRLLGQYALIYSLIVYFSIREHRRLRQVSRLQQSLFVLFCLLFSQCITFGAESIRAGNRLNYEFWYPAFTGALLWPAVFWCLRYVRLVARLV